MVNTEPRNAKSSDTTITIHRCRNFSPAMLLPYAGLVDWALITIGLLVAIFSGLATPFSFLIFRQILNSMMAGQIQYEMGTMDSNGFAEKIFRYLFIYALTAVVLFVGNFVSMVCLLIACERQLKQLRARMFASILSRECSWFDRQHVGATGKLIKILTTDIDRVRSGLGDKFVALIQISSSLFFGVSFAFSLSWRITLLPLIVVPFLVVVTFISLRAVRRADQHRRSDVDAPLTRACTIAEETIAGHQTVSAFNAQQFEIDRYTKCVRDSEPFGVRKAWANAALASSYVFFMFVAIALLFGFGSGYVFDKIISPGTLFVIFWLVFLYARQFGVALLSVDAIRSAIRIVFEMVELIEAQSEDSVDKKKSLSTNTNSSDTASYGETEKIYGAVEYLNVSFSYPSRPDVLVLSDISLCVEPNQMIAFVGQSGSGKTTLMELLMRTYEPTSGKIFLNGRSICEFDKSAMRQQISYVPQEITLFSDSILWNLCLGNGDVMFEEVVYACEMANAHEFISKMPNGYNTIIGNGGVSLSTGQKQRLGIARALIRKPLILILDEITSALDPENERFIQQSIEKIRIGRILFVIAHRLSTIKSADKIFVMENGHIVESGTHDELLTNTEGNYAKTFGCTTQHSSLFLDSADEILLLKSGRVEQHFRNEHTETENKIERKCLLVNKESIHEGRLKVPPPVLATGRKEDRRNDNNEKCSIPFATCKIFEKIGFAIQQRRQHLQISILSVISAIPNKCAFLAGVVLSLIGGFSWPVFAIIYGKMFVAIYSGPSFFSLFNQWNFEVTSLYAALFVVLGIVVGLCTLLGSGLLGWTGEKLATKLRIGTFKNIIRQDAEFFDTEAQSSLLSSLSGDPDRIQAAIDQRLGEVLQGSFSLILTTAIGFYFGWSIALVCACNNVIVTILQTIIKNKLQHNDKSVRLTKKAADQIGAEAIRSVKVLQLMNCKQQMMEKFLSELNKLYKANLWQSVLFSLSSAIAISYPLINCTITYYIGVFLIKSGHITPYILFQVLAAMNMGSLQLQSIVAYLPEYVNARSATNTLFRLLRVEPKIDGLSISGSTDKIHGRIEAKNLKFSYPGTKSKSLDGLNVSIEPGQLVALMGSSGCGKSTLFRLLMRNYEVIPSEANHLTIDGHPLSHYNIKHLRQNVVIVPAEPNLFDLTIWENICYGLDREPSHEEVELATKRAYIHEFIMGLPMRYQTRVGSRGSLLSGGQKQRIAIARALVRNPRILLLDEATSALDAESEIAVVNALNEAREGRACLAIIHKEIHD